MATLTMERLNSLVKPTRHYLLTESRYISLLEFALVVLLAISLADLVVGFIHQRYQTVDREPLLPPGALDERGYPPAAVTPAGRIAPESVRYLFGIPQPDVATGNGGIDADSLKETPLNLKLKGVLLNRDNGMRLALIARPGQAESIFREGEHIESAEILRIEPARVILRRNGSNEVLNMDIQKLDMTAATTTGTADSRAGGFGRNGVKQISDRERVVFQGTLRRELNNLPRLLQQARAVPYMENGRPMGFRLVSIQSGSVFEDLGLQREDVIRSVNGEQLLTPEDALNAYRDLRTSRSFQLELLRGGRQMTLNLSVQ